MFGRASTLRWWYCSSSRCLQRSPQRRQRSSGIHDSLWSTISGRFTRITIQWPLRCGKSRAARCDEFFHVGKRAATNAEALVSGSSGRSWRYGGDRISAGMLWSPRTTGNELLDLQNRCSRLPDAETNLKYISNNKWLQPALLLIWIVQ